MRFAFCAGFVALATLATPAWGQALVVPSCGSVTFTAGSLHQMTEDIHGYLCVEAPAAPPPLTRATDQAKPPPEEPKK